MKNAMAKHGLKLLTAVLFLFGALAFSATKAQAQSTDITLMNQSQNMTWISEAEAMTVLETQIMNLSNTLPTLTPGTPAYITALNQLIYYRLIYTDIEGGVSTQQATNANIFNLGNENGEKDDSPSGQIDLNQLYANALGLLTV
ncbi:MAG: hypothetical protein R3D58_14485 [Saprospiraceae bacterium]